MTFLKRTLFVAVALSLSALRVGAQQAETFVHTIKQGETVYSIARTYQVTPDEVLNLNPTAAAGIRAGDTLLIPQHQSQVQKERFHTIQAGETLYRLTKMYQVNADEICKANPGLSAENFKAGMVVRIPASTQTAAATVQEQPKPQGVANSGCKEMYKVKRKETIYSIARSFDLTEAELRAANKEMSNPDYKLCKGDFICIPYPKPKPVKENVLTNEELMSKKPIAATQSQIKMGVILPFKGGTQENEKMVEFYRGVLMAVERIKESGVSVDVFTYDSGKSADDIKQVTESHPITNLDFIIGPMYADQIPTLNAFCQQHHIKLVVPFTSTGDKVYNNPNYYAINPPKSYQQAEAARLVSELFGKQNIILLDGGEEDKDAESFIAAVQERIKQSGGQVTQLRLTDDEMKWTHAMNQFKENIIIPNTSNVKLLNQLFPKLEAFSKNSSEYTVKLVGYPEWQTYANSQIENYYKFDTYVYTSFFRNPTGDNTASFEKKYQKEFKSPTIVSWPRFGMLGYDTAMYFLKGISTYGDAFDQHLSQVSVTPYQHYFNFQRVSNWSGFINVETDLIRYSPSHRIDLIRLKK